MTTTRARGTRIGLAAAMALGLATTASPAAAQPDWVNVNTAPIIVWVDIPWQLDWPYDQVLGGQGWEVGDEVDASINGEHLGTATAAPNEWGTATPDFTEQLLDSGITLQAEDEIVFTLADGTRTETHVITSLTVETVSAESDTVSGTAEPGSWVFLQEWGVNCAVMADSQGAWEADYGGSADCDDVLDITSENFGWAAQFDADGNATAVVWTPPAGDLTVTGFTAPVEMGGVWNTVKGGRTVPLKFEVFQDGVEVTDPGVVTAFTQRQVPCGDGASTGEAVEGVSTTGATSLRYDPDAGHFVQNWKTPRDPGACYQVTLTTEDGSAISALFALT